MNGIEMPGVLRLTVSAPGNLRPQLQLLGFPPPIVSRDYHAI
jgi:hypothetical protein